MEKSRSGTSLSSKPNILSERRGEFLGFASQTSINFMQNECRNCNSCNLRVNIKDRSEGNKLAFDHIVRKEE
jgi:hypothetical protein